ncbi:unnamed protein product [Paramecium primaurelia]|uniref:MORN repeat protein n=1 Tax=Paramecium primaurelia TaxID=5886 RepID=A0A8S1PKA9_PARPR|nr:unnamed protein product [Paramecium primaurelia]
MGGIQSSQIQEPQRQQNSKIKTDCLSQRDGEKQNTYSFLALPNNQRQKEQNSIQSLSNSNSNQIKKYEYQEKKSFESPESHIENELKPEKQTKKDEEKYSFFNDKEKDEENENIEGTKMIGQAPILQINNIQSIENTQICIKNNYYPWLKQRLEKIEIYEPIEKFIDEQSQFVYNTTLSDQSQYEGFMKNGKRHGYGISLSQTELFEGSFQDGIRKGWGRRITKATVESGYWENNKMQKIMEKQEEDLYYKGECYNSIPNGRGYLKRSISIYTGDFVNGRMEGQGVLEDLIKKVKYEGQFLCDKFHGQGNYYFSSGKKYIGQFQNSQFHGQGEMFWPNKRYYKGQFVNGLFEGWGYLIDEDNSIYDGYWKNGKKNGKGKLTVKNLEIQGTWVNDEFQEGK